MDGLVAMLIFGVKLLVCGPCYGGIRRLLGFSMRLRFEFLD